MNILFSNSMMGLSKNSQELADEYPQPSQNTPHSFFQSLVAMYVVQMFV